MAPTHDRSRLPGTMQKRYEKALLTEDYLIRMINLMVAAFLRVVGLRTAGQYLAAQEAIDQVMEQVFGLPASMLRRLDDSVLLARLTHQGVLNTDQLLLLADLLKEEGELFTVQGYTAESFWSYLRALNFYLEVESRGGPHSYPAPHEKIDTLIHNLARFTLPADTLYALFVYYERQGAFARAEETLIKLLDTADYRQQVLVEAQEFYQRLMEHSSDELARGGLDRPHVEARLADVGGGTV